MQNRAYYTGLVGAWRGRYAFEIVDARALASISRGARLRARSMGLLTRLTGDTTMATTLTEDGDAFLHTTRVTAWGILVFETRELIVLGEDGASLRMSGSMRPLGGSSESYEAFGEIDATATRATYRVPWFGAEILQRTAIVPEGLELTQETPWLRARVVLRRTAE